MSQELFEEGSINESGWEIDTPSVVVDLDVVERNLSRLAQTTRERGIALRPHIKTHKSPYFAHRQLDHGAVGVTVATLGEAEVMVDGGVTDILLAYPPVGDIKLRRLAGLLERASISVSLDGMDAARALSKMCEKSGHTLRVYIDVDTGLKRMGLPPGKPSAELGSAIHTLPGLEVIGVMSHCGQIGSLPPDEMAQGAIDDAEALVMTANMMRDLGVPITVVSPGSTTGTPFAVDVEGVTEVRPGTYIFNDTNTVMAGVASFEDCAVAILTTVVSIPGPDRAVIDAGNKALSSDRSSKRKGHGWIKEYPHLTIRSLSEEHGVIALDEEAAARLRVGDRLQIVPNHVCPTVNLTDAYIAVKDGNVVGTIPVAARGRVK